LRQPGDHRPAFHRANHAASHVVIDDAEHDGDDAGDADDATVNDNVAKHDKHDALAGRRLSDHDRDHQHHNHAGQLPYASRGRRSVFVPQSPDHNGDGAEQSLCGWRLATDFFHGADALR